MTWIWRFYFIVKRYSTSLRSPETGQHNQIWLGLWLMTNCVKRWACQILFNVLSQLINVMAPIVWASIYWYLFDISKDLLPLNRVAYGFCFELSLQVEAIERFLIISTPAPWLGSPSHRLGQIEVTIQWLSKAFTSKGCGRTYFKDFQLI